MSKKGRVSTRWLFNARQHNANCLPTQSTHTRQTRIRKETIQMFQILSNATEDGLRLLNARDSSNQFSLATSPTTSISLTQTRSPYTSAKVLMLNNQMPILFLLVPMMIKCISSPSIPSTPNRFPTDSSKMLSSAFGVASGSSRIAY